METKINGAGVQTQVLFVYLARDQRGVVLQYAHTNRQIETLSDQIDKTRTQIQIKMDLRISFNKGSERTRQILLGIVLRHGNAQTAMGLHVVAVHKVLRGRDLFCHTTAMIEKFLSEVSKREAARGTQQQALSQSFFQIRQSARYRCLGHAQMLGSAHQAFVVRNGGEQDVIISGDIFLFHLWDSLSRIYGFIYLFETHNMLALYSTKENDMNTATQTTLQQSRTIERLIEGVATSDGAGVKLTRVLTGKLQIRLDPFLMLDAFGSDNPDDYIAGFPDHPHRGFETVTYMLSGRMRHRDSAGHEGLLGNGGVQWMTAGRGVIHSEIPEQKDGVMEGFQLWLNLPAQTKMSEPWYRDFSSEMIPEYVTS